MDLIFSDIGNTMPSASNAPSGKGAGETGGAGLSGSTEFDGQLNQAYGQVRTGTVNPGGQPAEESSNPDETVSVQDQDAETGIGAHQRPTPDRKWMESDEALSGAAAYESLEKTLNREGGLSFLTELKQLLLSLSNGDLDNISINQEGVFALKELLGDAGFDREAVNELMTELGLVSEDGDKEIRVSEFMDKLFDLPKEEEGEDIIETLNYMPTSDFPYVQSLLGLLGIDPEKISGIMSEASRGSRGFDLDVFIDQLRQLADNSLDSGISYQTKGDDTSHTRLLDQLGLATDTGSQGQLTLNQLVLAFEQKQEAFANRVPDSEANTAFFVQGGNTGEKQDLLAQLFSNLEFDSAKTDTANTDRVTGQIRDQIKADVLNQVSGIQPGKATPAKPAANDAATGRNTADQGKGSGPSFEVKADLVETTGEKNNSVNQTKENGSGYTESVPLTESGKTNTGFGTLDKVKQTFNSLPDHVTRQVGKNIVRAVNLGEETLRIQLKPAELGRVFMTIDSHGDTMKVSIITEHQSAKEILAANVNEIKTILSNSGISLERFEVDMSSDFRQSMADARDQDGRKKPGKNFNKANEGEDDTMPHISSLQGGSDTSGSLHYVA